MKKKLLFIWTFLLCFVGGLSADVVTIDFTAKGYENATEMTDVEQDGVKVTFDKGDNSNPPKYYTNGTAVRLYGGNSMTVAPVSSAQSVTKIVLTFGEKDGENEITTDVEAYADGTWEGSASSVTFTVGGTSGNRRIAKIEVTTAEPSAAAEPVTISPASGTDITVALNEAKAKVSKVGDITINLAAGGTYTVSGSIEAPAAVVINGNNATIDASALTSAMILMSSTPSVDVNDNGFYPINDVVIKDVKVTGLTQQLFYANKVKYLMENLTCENSIIQVAGGNKTVFDFNGGGVTGKFDILNSTIYSNPSNTGALYSSQSGDRATDAGLEKQTISIQNSTLYNIAYGKNVNTHRSANQKWLEYIVKNNIVLDCGKQGQFVKGLNGGQGGANPTWSIDGNTFLYTVDGVVTDQSGSETTGDTEEPITNSLVTNPMFKDIANGDFTIGAGTQQAKEKTGDPRWLVEYDAEQALPVPVTVAPATGTDIITALNEAKAKVDKVGDITINLEADGTYTVSGSIEAPAAVVINGNNATIDASALTSAMILMSSTPSVDVNDNGFYPINDVVIKDVKVTGLTQQLFYANKVKYLMDNLTCENSIIQVAGGNKTVFDFNGGGVTGKFDILNSTIYSDPSNTGALYSSQSGDRATDAGLEKQTISIQNSTLYNIAYGKNVNTHRSANQKWLEYIVKNNIVLDCGKQGQFVKGLNGGQGGANPTWSIDGNTFLYTVDGVVTDQSGSETTGDTEEPITNSLVTNPMFKDIANGDFTVGASTQQAKEKTGDPRWLVDYVAEDITDAKAALKAEIEKATALLGDADTEKEESAKTLKDAIDKAQGVYDTAEFNEILNAATEELKAAEEAYKSSTSGISIIGADTNVDNEAWYNLQGVRIDKPTQRGIYIHNGKKIVIK